MSSDFERGLQLLNLVNTWSSGLNNLSQKRFSELVDALREFDDSTKFNDNIKTSEDVDFNELKRTIQDRINFVDYYLSVKNDSMSIDKKIDFIVKKSSVSKNEFEKIPSWIENNVSRAKYLYEQTVFNESYLPSLLNFNKQLLMTANKLTKKYFKLIKKELNKRTLWSEYLDYVTIDFNEGDKPAHHPLGNIISLPMKKLFSLK